MFMLFNYFLTTLIYQNINGEYPSYKLLEQYLDVLFSRSVEEGSKINISSVNKQKKTISNYVMIICENKHQHSQLTTILKRVRTGMKPTLMRYPTIHQFLRRGLTGLSHGGILNHVVESDDLNFFTYFGRLL